MRELFDLLQVRFLLVFAEGVLSFFSPCVIPLLPVYMGYLAGNGKREMEDGSVVYDRRKVFLHTIFFILGISAAFFLLGISFTAMGSFFARNREIIVKAGGILILLLGLFQLGFFSPGVLWKEKKIPFRIPEGRMNPAVAFAMGFTFSFAWTPCVGPMLSSVLIMASGAETFLAGNFLVLVYAAGFLLPFLALGMFTTQLLNFLQKHRKLMKYTIRLGGLILIIMGILMFSGLINRVSAQLGTKNLNSVTSNKEVENTSNEGEPSTEASGTETAETGIEDAKIDTEAAETDTPKSSEMAAFDFTLTDQNGNMHRLSDYKGKVVFVNFWATWCPPCQAELPDIEALYHEYGENQEDVIFLGVTNPSSEENTNNADVSREEIESFLEENGYTFPVLYDTSGIVLEQYRITAFPTTFLMDGEGNISRYVVGMMTLDEMSDIIEETKEKNEDSGKNQDQGY